MSTYQIDVGFYSGKLGCNPDALHVKSKDEVTWTAPKELEHWAVVFGPEAPFEKRVLTPTDATTKVKAGRPGDHRRHKYVVVAWKGGKANVSDPDLIVDE